LQSGAGKKTVSESSDATGKRLKVLVMDDQDMLRNLVGKMLKAMRYEAGSASSGEEALRVCREALEAGKPFDAVILDLTVPGGMDGIETLAGLRKLDPRVKAIVSSGYPENIKRSSLDGCGVDAFLAKPYDVEKLAQVLRDVLEKDNDKPL